MILAPLIGGPLYDSIDYRGTCDFLALCCAIYSVFYFIFNVGCHIVGDEKKLKGDMEYLKNRMSRLPQVTLEQIEEKGEEEDEFNSEDENCQACEKEKLIEKEKEKEKEKERNKIDTDNS